MDSPYTLPEGNVAIAFSGGRTSAFMLHEILRVNRPLPERVVVTFQNTGREMPQTLDFVQECGERWGVRVVWLEYRLRFTGAHHDPKRGIFDSGAHQYEIVSHNSASRNGEPMEDVCRYFGVVPNREAKFCRTQLKERLQGRFLTSELGWPRWTAAIGIRADEQHRIPDEQPRERYRLWHPLNDAGVTKRDVARFWRAQSFDLRLPNVGGKTPLGNCDGCFLKSEANRAALCRDAPGRARWWAEQETRFGSTFHVSTSWDGLIDSVNRQGDWIFDTEGALCQADDGECV